MAKKALGWFWVPLGDLIVRKYVRKPPTNGLEIPRKPAKTRENPRNPAKSREGPQKSKGPLVLGHYENMRKALEIDYKTFFLERRHEFWRC